jgi:hypothetical protein
VLTPNTCGLGSKSLRLPERSKAKVPESGLLTITRTRVNSSVSERLNEPSELLFRQGRA